MNSGCYFEYLHIENYDVLCESRPALKLKLKFYSNCFDKKSLWNFDSVLFYNNKVFSLLIILVNFEFGFNNCNNLSFNLHPMITYPAPQGAKCSTMPGELICYSTAF